MMMTCDAQHRNLVRLSYTQVKQLPFQQNDEQVDML